MSIELIENWVALVSSMYVPDIVEVQESITIFNRDVSDLAKSSEEVLKLPGSGAWGNVADEHSLAVAGHFVGQSKFSFFLF